MRTFFNFLYRECASILSGLFHGHLFTDGSGTTDLSRVLGALVVLTFLAYQAYALFVLRQAFDATNFGTGAAALLAGTAVYVLGHNYAMAR